MEKWRGETENRIKASEIGFASSIKRQREDLAYREELESHLIDIFNDFDEEEIKEYSTAIRIAWNYGKALSEIPTREEINNQI